jgi:hypothetical protein
VGSLVFPETPPFPTDVIRNMTAIRSIAIAIALVGSCSLLLGRGECSGDESTKQATISFTRDVRTILSNKCFKCHGPDESSREGDLRLDRRKDAVKVLSPAKPKQSELLHRITSNDPDERMPPPDSKLSLNAREIDILRRWIEQGAPFEQHWAFKPIEAIVPPSLKQKDWPKNELDHFILARLHREGLRPSPEATRENLIRRLSFDLTGLPPSIEEINAFLANRSNDAYEKLVDRLLQKREFGERMTVDWLDIARYSDTYGYQVDRDRFVWPWRDWVIKAFNENLPYDRFITWQLAGDLLPNATDEQILATTFNRLHPQKVEGGSVPEEFRVEYVADRVHTFGTAFLGLALECARCHDHKFDPIGQKEYYQFFAFFDNIDEAGLYSYFTSAVPTPTLRLMESVTAKKKAAVEKRIAAAEGTLHGLAASRRVAFREWLSQRSGEVKIPGRIGHLHFEDHKSGQNKSVPGQVGKAVQLTGDHEIGLKVGNFHRYEPFSIALWMNTPDVKQRAVVFHRSRAWTDAGSRGYQLLIDQGKLCASLIHFWPGNAISLRTRKPIALKRWLHVAVTYDGSSRVDGLQIFVNGQPAECEVVRENLYKNITGGGGDHIAIGARFRDRGFTNGLVDEFQVFDRQLSSIEAAQLADGHSLADALSAPVEKFSKIQESELFDYYLATVDGEYRNQLGVLKAIREERSKTVDGIKEIMVMRELLKPRQTYLLRRGAYNAPTERVFPNTPAVFPPFPKGVPRNRLGLARWLTDPAQMLTARVAVNRIWQMCFGHGQVRTPEDFGSQGKLPTHPQALDWLAQRFIDSGWNVKGLLKMIVMSATYRQSSIVSSKLLSRDPDNILLARGPSYRLSAEMIRDNALSVSGLLVNTLGGPPARPYEVAVSFKPIQRDKGDGLYRRSLYTFWKRTAPAPVMMSLDASKRDVCTVKRERTSSPLQALVLLNDPQFVEAARLLAQNMIKKHGQNSDDLIEEMFRVLTSRRPSGGEREILKKLYDEQLAGFQRDPTRAEKFLKTGDTPRDKTIPPPRLAAATVLANALMNFDECVTKR